MSPSPSGSSPADSLAAAFSIAQQECDPSSKAELSALCASISVQNSSIVLNNELVLRQHIAALARISAFGSGRVRLAAHRLVWAIAHSLGIFPASIDQLYRAMAQQTLGRRFTVPAINMRAITYESARGVFQAMLESNTSAVIFELSRGEIGFTNQRPHEYVTSILCAAIAEGHTGPVFLQGDHFQISASRYREAPEQEKTAVAELIKEAISAGFFNIDIDASTLVDLSRVSIADQQELNIELSRQLAEVARAVQPVGVTVSLGGEIGEVGEHNSTLSELRAYLDGLARRLPESCAGIVKLSIQSGTRHGGNILADGSFGEMPIDFELIDSLSTACRDQFDVGGCVQHGASMLSLSKMAQLPEAGCIEVHLAAGFLNDVYDSLSDSVVSAVDQQLKEQFQHEWKTHWSEAQFIHHARRYAVGPNKKQWWDSVENHEVVRQKVKSRAAGYFKQLKVEGTDEIIAATITHNQVDWVAPPVSTNASHVDESTIGDLAS